MFYNNHIPYIKQLKDYYNTKDFEGYQRLAHTIKSNAKNIGAENFAKKALIQEKAVKEGDIKFIENTLNEFCSQYTQLANTIPNLISSAES